MFCEKNKNIKFKKNLLFKRIIFLIILLISLITIYNFSAQDGELSGTISKRVTEFIIEIISKIKNIDNNTKNYYINILHPIIRKLAHFGVYTVVGFSTMGFMCTFNMKNILKCLVSFSIGSCYAIMDELHQSFIPGRTSSIFDVAIDSLGTLAGIFILVVIIIFTESFINWLKK